jgi:GntR family transcriptional regulator, transcriptional repressor for pyruvate dehydrogenase complex
MTFRLMFNSLRAAYEPAIEALASLMREEVGQIGAYRVLTAAIAEGDADTARPAAERVLRPATHNLITALESLEETT